MRAVGADSARARQGGNAAPGAGADETQDAVAEALAQAEMEAAEEEAEEAEAVGIETLLAGAAPEVAAEAAALLLDQARPPPLPTVAPTRVPTVHSLPPSLAGACRQRPGGRRRRARRACARARRARCAVRAGWRGGCVGL